MNERSHSPHGKINLHGNGLGVPSPETVEKRAREIAMIDERDPDEFTEADWRQAKNELTGVEGSHAPEVDDTVDEEMSERDDIPGASGHHVAEHWFRGRRKSSAKNWSAAESRKRRMTRWSRRGGRNWNRNASNNEQRNGHG